MNSTKLRSVVGAAGAAAILALGAPGQDSFTFGEGCTLDPDDLSPGIKAQGSLVTGETLTIEIDKLSPSSPGILYFGFSDTTWAGLALPLDLTILGLPGCNLYTSVDGALPIVTDDGGKAEVSVVAWAPGLTIFFQAVGYPTDISKLSSTSGLAITPGL